MSTPTLAEINAATARDFDSDLLKLSPTECMSLLQKYIETGKTSDLPTRNDNVTIEGGYDLGRIIAGLIAKIHSIETTKTFEIWDDKRNFVYTDLDSTTRTVLPWSVFIGLSRRPTTLGGFDLFKNGEPLRAGVDYELDGATIVFAVAWISTDVGVIWIRTPATVDAIDKYYFTGADFTGSPSVANLNTLGVSPLPSIEQKLHVFAGLLQAQGVGFDYTWSSPAITFTYAVPSNQAVQIWVLP